jgi:hypothetical protein
MAWRGDSVGNAQQGAIGSALQGVPQGIHEESVNQLAPIGTRLGFPDGRAFRYTHFVAAVNAAVICSQDVSASAIAVTDGSMTAAAIGATQVVFTDTDLITTGDLKDQFAGGYFHMEDDAGEAYTYRIKGNDAGEASGTDGELVVDLYDGLVVAITTDTDVAVTGNIWKNNKIATANGDSIVSGVSMRSMTAAYYGWVQTWGPVSILAEVVGSSAPSIGNPAFLDDATAGAAMAFAGVASNTTLNAGDWDTPYIGDFLYAGTDAAHVGVNLRLYP